MIASKYIEDDKLSNPKKYEVKNIYDNGELVDNFEWYIKPHHNYNFFTNTSIHGIRKEDVENENEFVYFYDELSEILKDSIIVAHNAMFDIGVLNSVCDVYGLDHFLNPYIYFSFPIRAVIHSRFMRAMFERFICFGHSASQA